MAKITDLEDVVAPTGSEPVVIISGGRAKRTRFDRLAAPVLNAVVAAGEEAVADVEAAATAYVGFPGAAAQVATDRADVAETAADVTTKAADVTTKAGQVAGNKAATDLARDEAVAAAAAVDTTAIFNAKVSAAASASQSLADRLLADAAALLATNAKINAQAAAEASGGIKFYDTRADANFALVGLPDLQVVEVNADETWGGMRTRYRKQAGAYSFKLFFPRTAAIYADSRYGDDANDGSMPQSNGQGAGPVKTLARLGVVCGGNFTSGPDGFTGRGPRAAATVSLARGSEWFGEVLQNLPPFVLITSHGQGAQWIINASIPLPAAWTYEGSSGLYYQDYAVPNAAIGSYPGANSAHWMAFDRGLGFDVADDGLPRILNGDPLPDAQYDTWQPQKTTIAVTSQDALKAILTASPIGGFTVFPQGSTAYEPRVTWAGGPQPMRIWLKTPDGSNPNTNGRTIYIVGSNACAVFPQGCTVEDGTFACSGAKDMASGYFNNSPQSTMLGVSSGLTRRCRFLQHGGHGPVDMGMSHYDFHTRGGYVRDNVRYGCGSLHGFRNQNPLGPTAGRVLQGGLFERAGIAGYTHGNAGAILEQHTFHHMINCRMRDVGIVFVPGQTHSAKIVGCTGTDIGSLLGPDTTDKTMLVEDSSFTGRAGQPIQFGASLPGTTVRFRRSKVIAGVGGSVYLLTPDFRNALREIDPETYPTLILEDSKFVGRILDPGNAVFLQINMVVDGKCYVGVFDPVGSSNDVLIRGTITAAAGARLETARESIESLRARYPGIAAGVETGVRRQVWSKTMLLADLAFVAAGFTVTYSGSGTTLGSSFNYSAATVGRSIKIVGGGTAGADFVTRVVSVPTNTSIIVADAPPAAFAGKAAMRGVIGREPFKAPISAYVSTTGTQLSVPDGLLFKVGMNINIGQIRAAAPAFGVRKVTDIVGNILTLDAPINWLRKTNLQHNAIATPTNANFAPLPLVSVSWGYSFTLPNSVGFSPTFTLDKIEGGSVTSALNWSQVGGVDYERGFISPTVPSIAIGDVVTFTTEIEIPELRGIAA